MVSGETTTETGDPFTHREQMAHTRLTATRAQAVHLIDLIDEALGDRERMSKNVMIHGLAKVDGELCEAVRLLEVSLRWASRDEW